MVWFVRHAFLSLVLTITTAALGVALIWYFTVPGTLPRNAGFALVVGSPFVGALAFACFGIGAIRQAIRSSARSARFDGNRSVSTYPSRAAVPSTSGRGRRAPSQTAGARR